MLQQQLRNVPSKVIIDIDVKDATIRLKTVGHLMDAQTKSDVDFDWLVATHFRNICLSIRNLGKQKEK